MTSQESHVAPGDLAHVTRPEQLLAYHDPCRRVGRGCLEEGHGILLVVGFHDVDSRNWTKVLTSAGSLTYVSSWSFLSKRLGRAPEIVAGDP